MKRFGHRRFVVAALVVAALGAGVSAQIYKYYTPGSVWTVTEVRVKPGMEQAYHAYLDSTFKAGEEANVKAGYQKSYRVLETMGTNSDSWTVLILREYKDLASIEANAEKADALGAQIEGDDQKQMQGYEDRAKYREVLSTTYARELLLK
jgi:hypothetical protein